jgi:hypothetical protein
MRNKDGILYSQFSSKGHVSNFFEIPLIFLLILTSLLKIASVAETTVQKSVSYHHYAQYPSGWFFIRSFVGGSSTDAPLVLTADSATHNLSLIKISKEEWRSQLWMYWNGVLINFVTQLAIDVDSKCQ